MSKKVVLLFFAILVLNKFQAQITEYRKFQLDSITTNIPKEIRKNFDLVHAHLDSLGKNDEEKVWMFYGYIGTYFIYDKKRSKDNKALDYSTELTTQKASGVCRDFSKVFEIFCKKSKIPCMEIGGKSKMNIFKKIGRLIHFQSLKTDHIWNIVKFNNEWKLMDPTWSGINKIEKIVTLVEKKSKNKSAKVKSYEKKITLVKSVSRKYYDPTPEFMLKTHVPIHPAFVLMDSVPKFRKALKRNKKKLEFIKDYEFESKLDSIFNSKYPSFNKIFIFEASNYSKVDIAYYQYKYELALPLLKSTKYKPKTIEFYKDSKKHLEDLNLYIYENLGRKYSYEYEKCLAEIEKRRLKLVKLKEREKLVKKK